VFGENQTRFFYTFECMNIELLRENCINHNGVTEEFPFGEDTLVFKVHGKMFALTSLSEPNSVNLKCDPDKAETYRQEFNAVLPGYHMNKKHWNTVHFNQDVTDKLLLQMVADSYLLVVKSLPKKTQELLQAKK
jgi:predicted DNA-binding protein (MmcQ/YjbR family)